MMLYPFSFLEQDRNSMQIKKMSNVGYELTSLTQQFGTEMMTGPRLRYGALKN